MTSADDSRPNFFILLGLFPELPWDQAAYELALSEMRNLWARHAREDGQERTAAGAQRYLRLSREIERVMGDPRSRETERQAAIAEWQGVPDGRLRQLTDELEEMLAALRQRAEIAGRPSQDSGDDKEQRLAVLVDRYEASLEIARAISTRQFGKFLSEAAAQGIDIGVARKDLVKRLSQRRRPDDGPADAPRARFGAEVHCPGCSGGNAPESAYCAHCGRALRRPCPGCGTDVQGTARACPACGFPVGERDYVEHLVSAAETRLASRDVSGADERASDAARLWPVPAGRSDDLSERIQAQRARIAELRTAQRELIRQVDPLMNERRFLAAARLLRDAVATHPGLGGPLQECEDAIRASDQLLSDARAPGLPAEKRAELYSEALRACADNEDAQSELALLSLSPVIPGPISAEGHRPRFSAHHEVQVSCPPAERGEVRIVCAGLHEQSPQSGNEFPEGGLTRYRTMARGARDMWIFEKEWLRRYTLILVLYGRCYTGGTRWYARGPEVVGLRAEHTGSSVLVTWTWPAETPDGTEISEALVAWHDGPDAGDPVNAPAQQYVSREPGTAAGRYEIPAAGRLFVRVAVAVRHEGTAYLTSGVRADARRQPMTLRYEVRQARGHRGKLLISVDGGRLDQLPALSLRGGAGRGPVTQSGGGEIALIPAGLAAREIPVKLEDPGGRRIEPQSCRLFAADDPDGGVVRIIDPAWP